VRELLSVGADAVADNIMIQSAEELLWVIRCLHQIDNSPMFHPEAQNHMAVSA
jgi:hypothetical protein